MVFGNKFYFVSCNCCCCCCCCSRWTSSSLRCFGILESLANCLSAGQGTRELARTREKDTRKVEPKMEREMAALETLMACSAI